MNVLRLTKSALAGLVILTGFTAKADNLIAQIADWALIESSDGQTCYISTDNRDYNGPDGSFKQPNLFFTISKAKNKPEMPVEVLIKYTDRGNKNTGYMASISGASAIGTSDLNGSKNTYWGVSKNLSNFIEQIKRGREYIKVKTVGGRGENGDLSTSGFSDILELMQNNCNGGASLTNASFEQEFFASVPETIDPNRLDSAKSQQLRTVYYAAYKAAFHISNAAADLAKLLAKYQPLIDELNSNRTLAEKITNTDLPNSRQLLGNSLKLQADARAEIARIDAAIPGLLAKIEAAQKAYDAARAILAPHEPEYNRLTGSLSAAQNSLRQAESRLAYIDSRLRDGAQQIVNLDNEADYLERGLSQKRYELDRALSVYRDAESRRANYNVNWERENRLRNNYEYSRLLGERQQAQTMVRQTEVDAQRLRMERDRIARELQICRAGMISNDVKEAAEPRPPGVRPGPPGGGGGLVPGQPPRPPGPPPGQPPRPPGPPPGQPPRPPMPPPQPPAPPVRDCSHLVNALNNANHMLAQKEQENRQWQNRVNDINYRLSSIERQIDHEVRSEYNHLVNNEDQARRQYENINSEINRDQNRISQIRGSEIPELQREQTQLQSERPSVVSTITNARVDIGRLTDELARFKARTDWDRKAADVSRTEAQLRQEQNNLADAQAEKAAEQRRLEQGIATERQARQQIASLTAQLASLDARAEELNQGLSKLPEERAQFDATLAAQRVELANKKAEFLSLL